MIRPNRLAALALCLATLTASPALAQPAQLTLGGAEPIEVTSEGGFEFVESERIAIARGGVVAVQGELIIKADQVTARFRKLPDGKAEVYRLIAEGNVSVGTTKQTAMGDRAIYDGDKRVAVLTGGNLRLVTEEDVVTATQSLEYWRDLNLAVARGDATATRGKDKVRADRLVGLLEKNAEGQWAMSRVDAEGNVAISTDRETARGARGTYDLNSRIAILTGGVRITRERTQLSGSVAEVNLETRTSRLLGSGADARVRGLFIPDPGNGKTPALEEPAAPAPTTTPAPQPAASTPGR